MWDILGQSLGWWLLLLIVSGFFDLRIFLFMILITLCTNLQEVNKKLDFLLMDEEKYKNNR